MVVGRQLALTYHQCGPGSLEDSSPSSDAFCGMEIHAHPWLRAGKLLAK